MKVTVNVKWNKEIYKDVEVDLAEPPESFKIQIMSLTGVPIERQKVLGKGGMLQNDSWGKVSLKQGMTVMVMGTADEAMIPAKVEEPQFVEDLPEQEQEAVETRQYGAGLENLGNTCYMNACLQCMYRVPELKEAFAGPGGPTSSNALTREASKAFNIKCNVTSEINHIGEGIRLGLTEDREKRSESLGRTAQWSGKAALSTLPAYLTVQVMRFYFKVAAQQRAKIMRRVAFSHQLDMFEFCSKELQAKLRGPRKAYSDISDAKAGVASTAATNGDAVDGGQDADGDSEMAGNGQDYTGELTGRYDLIAVLTHKGRSLDAGHYVAWCKQDDGIWVQFDDDTMIPRKDEDILELAGGGDWHTAYLMLFKPQRVPEASKEAAPLNEASS